MRKDATLRVREDITVEAAGITIKRGIYREFPTLYRWKGYNSKVGFRVIEVLKDGKPENWFVKRLRNGVRIYIGNVNTFIKPGKHTYTLIYETDRQIGFFKDHDELYWNVTGTGWRLPILEVLATVSLPPEVPKDGIKYVAYTGRYGERGRDYDAWIDEGERVHFRTKRPLMPGENLTIVVGWPKGYVEEPGLWRRIAWFLEDNPSVVVLLFTTIVVFLYYLWMWAKVGKDLPKGTIVPQFAPPKGMSPAAVRYVMRMGYDDTCLVANLLDLAVKGALKIKEKERGHYVLEKLSTSSPGLTKDEKALLSSFTKILIIRRGSYSGVLKEVSERLKLTLAKKWEHLFHLNKTYVTLGVGLSIIGVLIAILLSGGEEIGGKILLSVAFFMYFLYTLFSSSPKGSKLLIRVGVALLLLLGFIFLFFYDGSIVGNTLVFGSLILLVAVNLFFGKYMPAPTKKGRKVMDQIEGFRMFLETAEKHRLKALFPKDNLPQIFERFLPYALALDVVETWANKFADDLKTMDYRPQWYEGHYYIQFTSPGGYTTFYSSLSSSMVGAVASASQPPGGSSGFSGGGFSGGGFSGGGGGGGGGGGW